MRASTGTSGRSSVSYTVATCSAAIRAFSAAHTRSVASACSAAYSAAVSISPQSNVTWPCQCRSPACAGWFGGRARILRQIVDAVTAAAGVEHVGHQHGVVVGENVDAAPGEHLPVELEILPILRTDGSSSTGCSSFSASFRDLVGAELGLGAQTGRRRSAGRPRDVRPGRSRRRWPRPQARNQRGGRSSGRRCCFGC